METGLTGEFRTAHASILSCPQERERIVGKSFPAPGNALLGHPRSYCSKFPTIPPAGHPDNVAADEAFYKIYVPSRQGGGNCHWDKGAPVSDSVTAIVSYPVVGADRRNTPETFHPRIKSPLLSTA